jgi:hypothetical protein
MAKDPIEDDHELRTLLDLNDIIFYMEDGYWVKFEAWKVKPTKHIPHGIRYSLTLHDGNNARIIGYDNAHNCLPKNRRYKARKETWDHIHEKRKIYPYEFDSASQLIDDFWETVEEYI